MKIIGRGPAQTEQKCDIAVARFDRGKSAAPGRDEGAQRLRVGVEAQGRHGITRGRGIGGGGLGLARGVPQTIGKDHDPAGAGPGILEQSMSLGDRSVEAMPAAGHQTRIQGRHHFADDPGVVRQRRHRVRFFGKNHQANAALHRGEHILQLVARPIQAIRGRVPCGHRRSQLEHRDRLGRVFVGQHGKPLPGRPRQGQNCRRRRQRESRHRPLHGPLRPPLDQVHKQFRIAHLTPSPCRILASINPDEHGQQGGQRPQPLGPQKMKGLTRHTDILPG